ncbi:MAG: carbonic anhydrase [Candidatus Kapabacteria bacterium]|nr:carbonic anhydrase [Candidatus Kapabacteria bacterium]
MDSYKRLLLNNKAFVQERLSLREDYFERMVDVQNPDFLWIGCSDSRIPAEVVTGSEPGELFVHRNVANLVVHTDFNMLSVLKYAVDVLKVDHVIVCGHYGCGGIKAALTRKDFGLINKWLRNVKDVYRVHEAELVALEDETKRFDRLVELNVIEQVSHLAEISFVQKAWKEENRPTLHGWVYDLHTGLIKEMIKIDPGEYPDDIYMYNFDEEV